MYILMTGVGENDNGKAAEGRNSTFPLKDPYGPRILLCVPFNEVRNDKYDQIANGYQRYDASVFQRIETAQEGKGYNNKPVIFR